MGFPGGSVVKNLFVNAGNAGDEGSILEWRRYSEGENGNPLQYSLLGNPMDSKAIGLQIVGMTEHLHVYSLVYKSGLFYFLKGCPK